MFSARLPAPHSRFCLPQRLLSIGLLAWPLLGTAGNASQANDTGLPGAMTRASVSSSERQVRRGSFVPALSSDGRFVAFESAAARLVRDDTNSAVDIFVRDQVRHTTRRVSVDSTGGQANGDSSFASISGDGRFVAYVSAADNLVTGDTNDASDVFVHDRRTGLTQRISVSSTGDQGNDASFSPSISADGRYVAFTSHADTLVDGDTNHVSDVFVHDRRTGVTRRASVDASGTQGDKQSSSGVLSADGRWLAFLSYATNLVPDDANNTADVLLRDLLTGTTTRVSVDSAGIQANAISAEAAISADGRFVVFQSAASNLVPGDTNSAFDIFVHDRLSQTTTRVSVDSNGVEGNAYSFDGRLSADGRFVAFGSWATNLDPSAVQTAADVFVHDRKTGKTTRISAAPDGTPGNSSSARGTLSADGRLVAFESDASNLIADDTNRASDIFVLDRWLNVKRSADLSITQNATLDTNAGSTRVTYQLIVSNLGPDTARHVTLSDWIPFNSELISAEPSQGQCSSASPVICYLNRVAPGEHASVTLIVQVRPSAKQVSNQAQTDAAPVDPIFHNNRDILITPIAE